MGLFLYYYKGILNCCENTIIIIVIYTNPRVLENTYKIKL